MLVLHSPYNNPFLNLALEDYFLRSPSYLPLLFFYVNRPCVVMGRFQNPWVEMNLPFLVEKDIWPVRRQSGGGCVYHDEGNLNFSFITPSGSINRLHHAELLQAAFKKANMEIFISPRHDLQIKDKNGVLKKISGSAYKQTKSSSFHHGTLLVNSDLEKLEEALKHTMVPKNSKSIPSVRSQVLTLNSNYPGITIDDVIELVSFHVGSNVQKVPGTFLSDHEVQEGFRHLLSDEWLWGETPLFELESRSGLIPVRKGKREDNGELFTAESMRNDLSPEEIRRFFPDFSEQHKSRNQLW